MKRLRRVAASLFVFLFPLFFLLGTGHAEVIRKAIWAGSFYPGDRHTLEKTIESFSELAEKTEVSTPPVERLRAVIFPHAGYAYSGLTAAHAARVLKDKKFAKIVLLGPDHRVGFRNGAVSEASHYETPLGLVKLHPDTAGLAKKSDLFKMIPASDRQEHSLEVILPFLQKYQDAFELVPIVLGPGDVGQIAHGIQDLLNQDTLLVISSDLSHYLPYPDAVKRDRETIELIMDLDIEKLVDRDNSACGKMPILVLLALARQYHWEPVFLHYSNSGDTAGGVDKVVGYTAIAFYGDEFMDEQRQASRQFTKEQGQQLVKLARQTIMEHLGIESSTPPAASLEPVLNDDIFKMHCGTFVTLKIADRLRGCIGNLAPSGSVVQGVKRNAVNAATQDYRFAPLSAEELNRVTIEVSILTKPESLHYTSAHDLVAKLRTHVDGVIIRKGHASATFLPQVWDQLPRTEDFLSHLCQKAGLAADAWKDEGLDVQTYQVAYFEEE
jgi:MEMO1 family protein